MQLHKINNVRVKPIPVQQSIDISKWKGSKIFSVRYPNVFLLAKKNSGKTTTLNTLVKQVLTKNTQVLIFSSTVHKDANMIHLVKYLESKGIPTVSYTSLYEDGINKLKEFYEDLEKKTESSDEEDEEEITRYILCEDEEKPPKAKIKEPVYIVIFDDLSAELKDRSISYFIKRNRHFKCLSIYSSQYYFDLAKDARNQIDYLLLFPSLPEEKIEDVIKETDIITPAKDVYKMYKLATLKKFNFLFVDIRNDKFRKNFDEEFI